MLRNYLTIALRSLRKRLGYSLINVAGLGMGLACCVLILLFVRDEFSYDRFHEDADRVYRVTFDAQPPNAPVDRFAMASRPVGRVLRAEYPEIEAVVRMSSWNPVVRHEGQYFYDDDFFFAEPAFFDVFSFPLVDGDPETALRAPNTLVLTEAMAEKYFGGVDRARGQSITLNDTLQFTVTGVLADFPSNSHFDTDFLVSYETLRAMQPAGDNDWLDLGTYTYLRLEEGASAAALAGKIEDLVTRHWGETLRQINFGVTLGLQPLPEIYMHSDRLAEIGPTGDLGYVYVFSAIAFFVLLLACINFMNLSTARSMERAKEVGVRKAVGAERGMLIRQFLSESVVLCGLALAIALVLIAAALPFFNELAGKDMTFATLMQPGYLAGLVGLTVAVGLLAGSYPAFVLSGFSTASVLRGTFATSSRGGVLRKALVAFQFAVSVALIACTLVVAHQLRYMNGQDLGFDREQVLVVDAQGLPDRMMTQQYETAKAEFARLPAVQQASATNVVPGRGSWVLIYTAEGLADEDSRRAQVVAADDDYTRTYGLELVAGRALSDAYATDVQEAALINEMAVDNIGWTSPEEAIGKTITVGSTTREVVGVIADYHHNSLKQAIEPMLLMSVPQSYNYFSLRVSTDDLPATLQAVEATWQRLFPGHTFDSFFLDEDFATQYEAERRLTKLFATFSGLAILIACLGLLGLAAFTAQQRTKEIGVRKALGASIAQIVALLSKEFTALVLVGFVVATPVAYLAMNRWLDGFAYRAGLPWWIFGLSGGLTLAVAWLTVSYQSIKAARLDPTKALRTD